MIVSMPVAVGPMQKLAQSLWSVKLMHLRNSPAAPPTPRLLSGSGRG